MGVDSHCNLVQYQWRPKLRSLVGYIRTRKPWSAFVNPYRHVKLVNRPLPHPRLQLTGMRQSGAKRERLIPVLSTRVRRVLSHPITHYAGETMASSEYNWHRVIYSRLAPTYLHNSPNGPGRFRVGFKGPQFPKGRQPTARDKLPAGMSWG